MITTVISIVKTITFICLKENNNTGKVRGKNVKFRYAGFEMPIQNSGLGIGRFSSVQLLSRVRLFATP